MAHAKFAAAMQLFSSAHSAPPTRAETAAPEPIAEPAAVDTHEFPCTEDVDSFSQLGVNPALCKTLEAHAITLPTEIQVTCIPRILAGVDVVGVAETGSGKTAAFAIPIIQNFLKDPYGAYALVLTPTRELALQLTEQFRAFGAPFGLAVCTVIGGAGTFTQAQQLAARPHVVVATPGRLAALIGDVKDVFAECAYLVLDEADKLASPDLARDIARITRFLPRHPRRHTLFFTATLTDELAGGAARRGAHIAKAVRGRAELPRTLRAQYILVARPQLKLAWLAWLLKHWAGFGRGVETPDGDSAEIISEVLGGARDDRAAETRAAPAPGGKQVIIFEATRRSASLLFFSLRALGVDAAPLHAGMHQDARIAALRRFRSRRASVLVTTDVASRGLDIPVVGLVVNMSVPAFPTDFVHRAGRTARAGRTGTVLSFVTPAELERLLAVEEHIERRMEPVEALSSALERGRQVRADEETVLAEFLNKATRAYQAALGRLAMKEAERNGTDF